MKDVPEIAPEIRGLLEEIVADPRSAIRFAPRRALGPWVESGETLRAGEVSGTKAERHLVAAHRESLARILYEGARIAYWKAPILAHRPLDKDGKPYDPTREEPAWRTRAQRKVQHSARDAEGVQLLRQCLEGVQPEHGLSLACASLALVSEERGHVNLGVLLGPNQARASLRIFERMASTAVAESVRDLAWGEIGRTLCSIGALDQAREAYRNAGHLWQNAMCVFNLSLLLGDNREIVAASLALDELPSDHPSVLEGRQLLAQWLATRPPGDKHKGARQMRGTADRLGQTARAIGAIYE